MSKIKTHIQKNHAGTGYECLYEFNGVLYPANSIKTFDKLQGNICTRSTYDINTGELLHTSVVDLISRNNSKAYMYKNGFEVAKDKNVPREKKLSNGQHIIDMCKEYSDYLQVSTGSQHDKRGIIAADLDLSIPENESDVKSFVLDKLTKYFDRMNILGISLPTSYQIHLTNGHVQMFWVLEDEITIKKFKHKLITDLGITRKVYYFENTGLWSAYRRVQHFYAYLTDGDHNFTGWQIKNMFLTDEVFKDSFHTMWLNDDRYTEEEPENIKTYSFTVLHNEIYDIVKNPQKTDIFLNIIGHGDIVEQEKEHMICDEFMLSKSVQAKFEIHKEKKNIVISEGRNQFVRMKTYEFVRLYKNNISADRCRRMVKTALNAALKEHGKLPGTKNETPYTETDFERDFSGAYYHAVTTYTSYSGYTDEQRERAKKQLANKKNVAQMALLAVLEEHPELIPSTKPNNEKIAELITEYNPNVIIKSYNTISNYKNELGIKNTQKKLSPKNYKKADKAYRERIVRKIELCNTYKEIKDTMYMSKEQKESWEKRMSTISSSKKVFDIYKKRKRLTSSLIVIRYYIDVITQRIHIENHNFLMKDNPTESESKIMM